MEKNPIPLPDQYLEVLHKDLDWQEIKWGVDYITARDKAYKSKRDFFFRLNLLAILNFKLYDIKRGDQRKMQTISIE